MGKKEPMVSIVLPTYNVKKYLEQCLMSIHAQTYQNYEVIIVIDGATDGTYEIANKYCESHDKFNVIYQENAGSGPARNNGLAHVKGEFVMFVDPDDWLEPECLEKLMETQQEGDYDLTISQKINYVFDENDSCVSIDKLKGYDFNIIGEHNCRSKYLDVLDFGLVSAPTRKIYRMDIIRNNSVCFPDYRRSQDIVFNYRYYNHIKSLKSIDYCGYNYRMQIRESANKLKPEYYKTIISIYNDIVELHQQWNIQIDLSRLTSIVFVEFLYGYLQVAAYYKYDIKEVLKNNYIKQIINYACPQKKYIRLVQSLLKYNLEKSATIVLKYIFIMKLKMR